MLGEENDRARRGLSAHLAVAWRLVERGFEVLEPFGDHLRYDLAYYYSGEPGRVFHKKEDPALVRIQCKAGRLSKDGTTIRFNAFNMTGGRGKKRSYIGDAEYFGVYCEELRKVYLIPVEECALGEKALHLKSAGRKRGNRWGSKSIEYATDIQDCTWAEDYEI